MKNRKIDTRLWILLLAVAFGCQKKSTAPIFESYFKADGIWAGTTDQNEKISFRLDTSAVKAFSIRIQIQSEIAGISLDASAGQPIAIASRNAFSFSRSGLNVTAGFLSDTTCEGTFEYGGISGRWSCVKSDSVPDDDFQMPEGWRLVWHDEFDGPEIDPEKWSFEVNGRGGGNNELQYYTDRVDNSFIENGSLVIQALKEEYTGTDGTRGYTSARIRTKNKGDWKYGRFDIRARLPFSQGIWPAIWMMPTDGVYGSWPSSGEIDIMEELGQEPKRVYQTLHFGGTGAHAQTGGSYVLKSGSFSDDFHLYTLEWDSTAMRWLVDNAQVMTKKAESWYTTAAPRPAPFDQRFYMVLNLAIGGNWPKNPDATTRFPQRLTVDYVRVFRKAQ
jgi:beta-glucanase (GH16 family)